MEWKVNEIRVPRRSDTTNYTTTSVSQESAVPAAWKGRYVTLVSIGQDSYISFTEATSNDVTASNGWPLKADIPQMFYVDSAVTHFQRIRASADGNIRAYPSSPGHVR